MNERSNRVPKSMEASERYEMKYPHPGHESKKCHVQERHTAVTVTIMVQKFYFPPPFLASNPIIFNKLDGDSICLCCDKIRCH